VTTPSIAHIAHIAHTDPEEPPMNDVPDVPTAAAHDTTSRRGVLRTMMTAAAGAAAVTLVGSSDHAHAATGAMQFGASNNAGTSTTSLTAAVADGRALSVDNSATGGYAVAGDADFLYGGAARQGGINLTSAGFGAIIVAQNDGVVGVSNRGTAVRGSSDTGIGAAASGGRADLLLAGIGDSPLSRLDAHGAGEILKDRDQNLWLCVAAGSPGTWRKLAGPATAGSLHVVEPTRVYDSRWSSGGGPLVSGSSRGIDISAGRNLATGAIETANLVPAKAVAAHYTITVTDTVGAGFVAVTSIGASTFRASTINWSAPGSILANSTLGKITSPELRLWCGGGGSTHIIIDILGYHL
jgi:hypothetical protein